MDRGPTWAALCLSLLVMGLPGCALRQARNRPLLARLDEVLPEVETTAGRVALGVGILPVTIPAGVLDTFVANPALQTGEAASDTRELLWSDADSSLFQEAALFVPKLAARLPSRIQQVVPSHYKNPDQLPNGGVLVVGASASGIQLAQEIQRSGRPVTLAVGRHTRIPRRYRGRDIAWWLEASGILGERAERAFNLESARRQPSLQLVGTPDHRTIDLGVLQEEGVSLAGRLESTDGMRVGFCDDLGRNMDAAERKLDRLLERIDAFIDETLMAASAPNRRRPIIASDAPAELNLRDAGISSVFWATGYRRRYPWLNVPVLNIRGEIIHDAGVTPAAGIYALGLNFQRTRKSSFIDGVGNDARVVANHIAQRFHRSSIAA